MDRAGLPSLRLASASGHLQRRLWGLRPRPTNVAQALPRRMMGRNLDKEAAILALLTGPQPTSENLAPMVFMVACPMLYPMYTLPLQILMDMTTVSPHEELRDAGFVVEFEQSILDVLGSKLAPAWAGPSSSRTNGWGGPTQIRKARVGSLLLRERRLFLWYDYFCCPQKSNAADMKLAIDSIPTYIARCELFVILCSEAEHVERGLGTDLSTWAERGWCRIERMARELSAGNTTMISIESPSLQTYEPPWQAAFFPPGEGRFSSQGDRDKVAAILKQIFGAKLLDCLAKEDLCSYRFWLNQKRMRFSGFNVPDSEVVAVLKQQVAAKLVHCLEQEDMVAYHFW
ncbi:ASPH, partial [Symbiodinium microadriaticum]